MIAPASLKQRFGDLGTADEVGFRGVIAPASLKREADRGRAASAEPFPGRDRPGFIEAPTARPKSKSTWPRFRSMSAPASLKLADVGSGDHVLDAFPGR